MNPLEENRPHGRDQLPAGTRHASAMFTNYFEAFKNMTVLRESGLRCSPLFWINQEAWRGPHHHPFRAARQMTRVSEAVVVTGEQAADQEYYDLRSRHGEKYGRIHPAVVTGR
jgi:hypothetical protein